MSQEPTITCPSCRSEIKLTESLAAPLLEATKREFEQKLTKQATEYAEREQQVKVREAKLAADRETLDATLDSRLKDERKKLADDAAKKDQAFKTREAELAAARESLDATLAERMKDERAKVAADAAKRDKAFADREAALTKQKESLDADVAEKLKAERAKITAEESRKAKLALGEELDAKARENAEMAERMKAQSEKLADAQKAQAELVRRTRELDDQKHAMELTIETRISESLGKTREQAKQEAEQAQSLKLLEKEQVIASMQQKIEELKKKAEQGSQQLQGEALELQLESKLSAKFPTDVFEPVPKGEFGGDLIQRVNAPNGTRCGTILWETKRTKNWQDGWLPKLRDDQRAAKAGIAILVSAVLPPGVDSFDQVDGVWIVHPKCVLPVAMSLRHMLAEVTTARVASEGQQTKTELVYRYLTGPNFRHRVEAIVEAFSDMSDDLAAERKAIQKQWAKREKQLERMMEATVGMYGDLQGIAGKSLGEIEGLAMSADNPAALPTF